MPAAVVSTGRRSVSRTARASAAGSWWPRYARYSRSPLGSLFFILPLLALHEWGIWQYGLASGRLVEHRVAAYGLMCRFFAWFGTSARYLPAMAVAITLLAEHIVRRDRWELNIAALGRMAIESILLAVPLAGVYWLARDSVHLRWAGSDWKLLAATYLGAGVYEEFLFRLAAFALLSWLLVDLGKLPLKWGTPIVMVLAALGFAAYHMLGIATTSKQQLVFITLRGIYYGIIFHHRGFGLSIGVHTSYDLISGLVLWENS